MKFQYFALDRLPIHSLSDLYNPSTNHDCCSENKVRTSKNKRVISRRESKRVQKDARRTGKGMGIAAKQLVLNGKMRRMVLDLVDIVQDIVNAGMGKKNKTAQTSVTQTTQTTTQTAQTMQTVGTSMPYVSMTPSTDMNAEATVTTTGYDGSVLVERLPVQTLPTTGYASEVYVAPVAPVQVSETLIQNITTTEGQPQMGSTATQSKVMRRISPEHRKELARRLLRILTELNQHDDVARGIRSMIKLIDVGVNLATKNSKKVANKGSELKETNLRLAFDELMALFGYFAPHGGMKAILRDSKNLIKSFQQDSRTRHILREFRDLIESALKHPDRVNEEQLVLRIERLIDDSTNLTEDYVNRSRSVLKQWGRLFKNIERNEDLLRFQSSIHRLFENIFPIQQGRPMPNVQLFKEIGMFLGPYLSRKMRKMPLPSVTGSTGVIDFSLSGLKLDMKDFLPEQFDVDIRTRSIFDVKHKAGVAFHHTRLYLTVRDISFNLKKFNYWFNLKKFMKLNSQGKMTVGVHGATMTMQIDLLVPKKGDVPVFYMRKLKLKLKHLKFRAHKGAKHRGLMNNGFSIAHPTVLRILRKRINKQLAVMRKKVERQVNTMLLDAHNNALERRRTARKARRAARKARRQASVKTTGIRPATTTVTTTTATEHRHKRKHRDHDTVIVTDRAAPVVITAPVQKERPVIVTATTTEHPDGSVQKTVEAKSNAPTKMIVTEDKELIANELDSGVRSDFAA